MVSLWLLGSIRSVVDSDACVEKLFEDVRTVWERSLAVGKFRCLEESVRAQSIVLAVSGGAIPVVAPFMTLSSYEIAAIHLSCLNRLVAATSMFLLKSSRRDTCLSLPSRIYFRPGKERKDTQSLA